MTYYGIDISKNTIDVCRAGYHQVTTYSNTPDGWLELLNDSDLTNAWYIMEATGPYFVGLAHWLFDQGQRVSVVNPLVIRRYGQSKLKRVKTDKTDARLIADYGCRHYHDLEEWRPKSAVTAQIRHLIALLQKNSKIETMVKNQREAFKQDTRASQTSLPFVQQHLEFLQQQKKQIEKQLKQLATAEYGQILNSLQSIPGIGFKTAVILCAITEGLTRFETSQQLASYAGICPSPYESGTTVRGRGHISKIGCGLLRKQLYMCALPARRFNSGCIKLHERLTTAGKPRNVVRIAVANKLLRQAFVIGKTNGNFDAQKALGY